MFDISNGKITSEDRVEILMYSLVLKDKTGNAIKTIENVTSDYGKVKAFVDLCNSHDIADCHISDIVEDFITSLYL